MTTCSLELKFVLCYKWWKYYLEFTNVKLSNKTKLIIILSKLAQLVKIELSLIKGKLYCILKSIRDVIFSNHLQRTRRSSQNVKLHVKCCFMWLGLHGKPQFSWVCTQKSHLINRNLRYLSFSKQLTHTVTIRNLKSRLKKSYEELCNKISLLPIGRSCVCHTFLPHSRWLKLGLWCSRNFRFFGKRIPINVQY